MLNMKLKQFLAKYNTHDGRMYNIKFDVIDKYLEFTLENVNWSQQQNEENGQFYTSLKLRFKNIENFNLSQEYSVNPKQTLEEMDEFILGIYLDGETVVSIITDEYEPEITEGRETVIKFVAESVDVEEITSDEERKRILYD